jgi:xanthine dehydrogenase accessory factor
MTVMKSRLGSQSLGLTSLMVLIKGAGEMASGIAHRLFMANITRIVMTEIPRPLCVRRTVAFSEAVYEGLAEVEGVKAVYAEDIGKTLALWNQERIVVLIDQVGRTVEELKPHVVVDATMRKQKQETGKNQAPLVIGVGPGFEAPRDVHMVVESNRGHDLGRVIYNGSAEPYTATPAPTMGYTFERVLRSPHRGTVRHVKTIGDTIKTGDIVLYVNQTPVAAGIDGILRGVIREIEVEENEKVGDIDPRGRKEYCYTITEKARSIGGGVLEGILHMYNRIDQGKPGLSERRGSIIQ